MSKYSLNFPVFYACAIRGRTSKRQLDTVQALLTGKYARECLEEDKIEESVISGYVSGKRPISVGTIYAINECEHAELVRRFQMLDLYNCDDSAQNVRRFLEEVQPVGATETRRLLDYGESCETPLDFLVEVFLAALRCPPVRVTALEKRTRDRLRDGEFSEENGDVAAPSTQIQRKATLSSKEGADDNKFDYELRQLRLREPQEKERIQRFIAAMIQNENEEPGGRAPIIREGEDSIAPFWAMLSATKNGVYYEIQGTNTQIRETLRNLSGLSQCEGIILFMDSNPDISTPDFYAIRDDVVKRSLPGAKVSVFLRISDRVDGKNTLYIVLIANPLFTSRRQRPTSTMRAPVHRKRNY